MGSITSLPVYDTVMESENQEEAQGKKEKDDAPKSGSDQASKPKGPSEEDIDDDTDERLRKLEELEEEAGMHKQVYVTLWGLARQRRRKYLKTRYDQVSWTLESMGYNPDEEEEMVERGKYKRQRTSYLS
eukprot:g45248.t1